MFKQMIKRAREVLVRAAIALWEFVVLIWLATYYFSETFVLTMTPGFFRKEKRLKGKVVLITGGAGGIGQELALRLARSKAEVVVWDNNEKSIEDLRMRLHADGQKVHTYTVDVTDRHSIYKNADLVKNEVGPVDILINNAGIVSGQTFLDIPDHMIEKSFQVNVIAHYWAHGHHHIHMSLVCPYFVNTGMFAGCKPRSLSMLEPRDVAKRIITAIKRNEVFVTIPTIARFVFPLKHFLPAKLSWAVMHRIVQGPRSMMGLKKYDDAVAA